MNKKNKGFTLIELVVVIIIIGVVAGVALPMFYRIKGKAICTEAVTAMGTIRRAIKMYRLEGDFYFPSSPRIYADPIVYRLGLTPEELQGVYFGKECYQISVQLDPNHWANFVQVRFGGVNPNSAPRASEATALANASNPIVGGYMRMYLKTGKVVQGGASATGYPQDNFWP